jgi:hypothetical protein
MEKNRKNRNSNFSKVFAHSKHTSVNPLPSKQLLCFVLDHVKPEIDNQNQTRRIAQMLCSHFHSQLRKKAKLFALS